jgi:hypothetical protein
LKSLDMNSLMGILLLHIDASSVWVMDQLLLQQER